MEAYKPWNFCKAIDCPALMAYPIDCSQQIGLPFIDWDKERKTLYCNGCKAYKMHQYLKEHGQIIEEGSELAAQFVDVQQYIYENGISKEDCKRAIEMVKEDALKELEQLRSKYEKCAEMLGDMVDVAEVTGSAYLYRRDVGPIKEMLVQAKAGEE